MKHLSFLFIGLLLFSCNSAVKTTSEQELRDLFSDYLSGKYPELRKGDHIVFIANNSECSPCIEAINTILRGNYEAQRYAILFSNHRFSLPPNVKVLKEHAKTVGKYGILKGDGSICVFRNGKLSAIVPMNVDNPEWSVQSVSKQLKN